MPGKGRGAQTTRPGYVIKSVLLGNIPLLDGSRLTEACCTDVHNVYQELTRAETAGRPKHLQHLRKLGMTRMSFVTLWRHARALGLIEYVRDEPMLFPPPGGPLLHVLKDDEPRVVESKRRFYRLTDAGKDESVMWGDLTGARQKQT